MMKSPKITFTMLLMGWLLSGCGETASMAEEIKPGNTADSLGNASNNATVYNRKSRIADVMADSAFGDYGRLLFPGQRAYFLIPKYNS